MLFDDWCESVRERFQQAFGYVPPKTPNLVELESNVQERIMRCGNEARRFGLEHYDERAILAHHTLILDDVRNGQTRYVSRA